MATFERVMTVARIQYEKAILCTCAMPVRCSSGCGKRINPGHYFTIAEAAGSTPECSDCAPYRYT